MSALIKNVFLILSFAVVVALYFHLNKKVSDVVAKNKRLQISATQYRQALHRNLEATLTLQTYWSDIVSETGLTSDNNSNYSLFLLIDARTCRECLEHELNNLRKLRSSFKKVITYGVLAININKKLLFQDSQFDFIINNTHTISGGPLADNLSKFTGQPVYLILKNKKLVACYLFPKFDTNSFENMIKSLTNEGVDS